MWKNDFLLDDMRSVSNFDMWSNADYNLYDVIKTIGKKTYFISRDKEKKQNQLKRYFLLEIVIVQTIKKMKI